jgi:uncharacterized protein
MTYDPHAKLLRIHITERDQRDGKPLYEAIVEKCRELQISGATVFRGQEGFGDTAEIHRSHLIGHELPIVIQVVDSAANIDRLIPALETMVESGLLAVSDVSARRVQRT